MLEKNIFKQKITKRPLFIPLLNKFAAKIEQISVQELYNNPLLLSKALRNSQKLYKTDGIIIIFDPTLEAEALGCSVFWEDNGPIITNHPYSKDNKIIQITPDTALDKGRIPIIMEATRQLKITIGDVVPIGTVITGPLTIASNLIGQNIINTLEKDPKTANGLIKMSSKVIIALCKRYCEMGVDFIILADEYLLAVNKSYFGDLSKYLRPFYNIARYYEVPTIILTKNSYNADILKIICSLNSDGIILSQPSLNIIEYIENLNKEIIGIGLPLETIFSNKEEIKSVIAQLAQLSSKGSFKMFLTTEWEIPFETSVDDVIRFMRQVNNYLRKLI